MKLRKRISLPLLAVFFMAAGTMHFLRPAFYLKLMPPYLPAPESLVLASGAFEIALGGLTLFEKTRRPAGWGLMLLLLAVLPANVHVALHPGIFPGLPTWAAWARLPLQALFMLWVWHACGLGKSQNGRT